MNASAIRRLLHGTAVLAIPALCAGFSPAANSLQLAGELSLQASDGGSAQVAFQCDGENPCRGTYAAQLRTGGCAGELGLVDSLVITGLDLAAPGPVSGTLTLSAIDGIDATRAPDGSCVNYTGPGSDFSATFTGTWDGTTVAIQSPPLPSGGATVTLSGRASLVTRQVRITGSMAGADRGTVRIAFSCEGENPCAGTAEASFVDEGCPNGLAFNDRFVLVGLDLSRPGPISGGMILRNGDYVTNRVPGSACQYVLPGGRGGGGFFTGTWDGTTGTFEIPVPEYLIRGTFTATTAPLSTTRLPPVFPMTVTTNITPTVASATANIQFRPQDVGGSGSVYTFAIAPENQVRPAADGSAPFVVGKSATSRQTKDTPVACVLAQLTASGQLQATSYASLQAFVTGAFTALGQSVPVIGAVPTGNVAGATFFVGYGTSASAMLSGGINRSVVTVPGSTLCQPQAPQTGWWWNASESGRGYTIEVSGRNLFFSSYLYDATGRSTWAISAGPTSLDGSLYVGNLESYAGGQTLTGAYRAPTRPPTVAGSMILAFNTATRGTLTWPGGIVPIERYEFGSGGVNAVAKPGQPENGWWWNPDESGRGFFIEWQSGIAFLAGFMYEADGHPVWYIAAGSTPDPRNFSGNWEQYANGQTLTGAYRRPDLANPAVGPATIRFQGAQDAIMTLPGGRTIPLTRQRF